MLQQPKENYDPRDIAEYNPSDLANLVRYCVQELLQRSAYRLPLLESFPGAGIYALFYDGELAIYQHDSIRSTDHRQPIYVGRARLTKSSGLNPLFKRIRDHARSIEAAENLRVEEFRVRFLVLHPLWVSTVEDLLIGHFSTLWNDVIEGFGIHDPGGKRHEGEIPLWDVLHPGRSHRNKMIERGAVGRPMTEVMKLVEEYQARGERVKGSLSFDEANTILREASSEELSEEESDVLD